MRVERLEVFTALGETWGLLTRAYPMNNQYYYINKGQPNWNNPMDEIEFAEVLVEIENALQTQER
jgi:hypothetical protein